MYGAILGDIIGSPFEFDRGNKTKDFELFTRGIEEGIRLKENVSVEKLWEQFRGYLSVDVMLAFIDKASVSALGVGIC